MKFLNTLRNKAAQFDAALQFESLLIKKLKLDKIVAEVKTEEVTKDDLKKAIIKNLDKRLNLVFLSHQNEDT